MKAIFSTLSSIFSITALIMHIWTAYIAFTIGGLLAGIISLFLPVIAEIYWVYKLMGHNSTYVTLAIVHLILAIPFWLFGRNK